METTPIDVLVVGAGPVGLFCANELMRHGLRCRIIDKKSGLSEQSKALGIHIRTLDVFDDTDFLDEILSQGQKISGILVKSNQRILINAEFKEIKSNFSFAICLPQDKTEKILAQGLETKGLKVEWETELVTLEQTSAGARAIVRHLDQEEEINVPWVIGCDGAHSTVRHQLGLEFVGAPYSQSWWLADVHLHWNVPQDRMVAYLSPYGPLACFPMGNERYRFVMLAPANQDKEPDFSAIISEFKRRSSDPGRLSNPVWITKFHLHHRQVQHYRSNRVFLAGDAAHIHSPMGGQGLNTGIQDIYNLVWKLALVHKKQAKEAVLNSYHAERFPVGQDVLKKTDQMTRAILLKNPVLRHVRNRLIMTVLAIPYIRKKVIRDLAELTISYTESPIVAEQGHRRHWEAGLFMYDFELVNIEDQSVVSLKNIVKGTQHHLLLFQGLGSLDVTHLVEVAKMIKERYARHIVPHFVLAQEIAPPELQGLGRIWLDPNQKIHRHHAIETSCAVLLRPDKYIGLTQSPIHQAELVRYLKTIFTVGYLIP